MIETHFTTAIVRTPGPDFGGGLTTASLGMPDYGIMLSQHAAYVEALRSLGLEVVVLDPLPGFPDAYFVEDVAVIVPETAVITRPGALERRGEIEAIEPVLARYRKTVRIQAPGTLDGGDVLIAGMECFIGLSDRTNEEGARQLGCILEGQGYHWTEVPVQGGLHLKSSVNYVGSNTLLLSSQFAEMPYFDSYNKIILDDEEIYAGNTLYINGNLLTPSGFKRTYRKLEELGLPLILIQASEARKMDGGLTCMSLRF